MILTVNFLDKAVSFDKVIDIPCLCKVKDNIFTIVFVTVHDSDFNNIQGDLDEWSLKALNDRFPSRAGGDYTYYEPGLISIEAINQNIYKVLSLKLFSNETGWLPFIEKGEYADITQYWDDEPDWLP